MAQDKKTAHIASPDDPDFVLDDYPLYSLNLTSWTYIDEMSKILKTIGMDQPSWRVLMLLGDKNPSTVTELSQRSVTKMSTITRIIIRMEAEGLVSRATSPADSRVTEVFITHEGASVLEKLKAIAGRIYRKAIEGFDEAEIAIFVDTLRRMRENLTRSPYLD